MSWYELEAHPDWEKLPGWHKAYTGLTLYYYAIVAAILGVGALLLGALLVRVLGTWYLYVMLYGIPLGYLAILGLMVAGLVNFSAVPVESGARGLVMGALICFIISLILSVISLIMTFSGGGGGMGIGFGGRGAGVFIVLGLLDNLISMTSLVLLMLSLRQVGRFVGAFAAAGNATTTIVLFGIVYGFQLLVVLAPGVFIGLGQGFAMVITMALPALGIVGLIFFMYAVNGVRTAIMSGALEEGDIY